MSEENTYNRQNLGLGWPKEAGSLNNYGFLSGKLQGEFQYSHRFCRHNYYKTRIEIRRRSGTLDIIPIVVSEEVLENCEVKELRDRYVIITGQICTHDVRSNFSKDGNDHHLRIFFSVDTIAECECQDDPNNLVYLKGQICRPPFIKTKASGIKVAEILIAAKRQSGKKDYIPCVSWDPIASSVEKELAIGDAVQLRGRLQSRKYYKKNWKNPNDEGEYRTTYEVAIAEII